MAFARERQNSWNIIWMCIRYLAEAVHYMQAQRQIRQQIHSE